MSPPPNAGSLPARRALVRAVAGEAHPRDPERDAVECAGREGHMRQRLIVERDFDARGLNEIARARARDGERGPLRGRIVNDDTGGVEAILAPEFEARAQGVHMSGRAGDEKAVLRETQGHAVVEHDA